MSVESVRAFMHQQQERIEELEAMAAENARLRALCEKLNCEVSQWQTVHGAEATVQSLKNDVSRLQAELTAAREALSEIGDQLGCCPRCSAIARAALQRPDGEGACRMHPVGRGGEVSHVIGGDWCASVCTYSNEEDCERQARSNCTCAPPPAVREGHEPGCEEARQKLGPGYCCCLNGRNG